MDNLILRGSYAAKDLKCPGSGAEGVLAALDYLTASNRKGLGDCVPAFDSGELNAEAKRVVVIGGGDTAMDCVRTAVRQGAKSVTCLYRRDRANMPRQQHCTTTTATLHDVPLGCTHTVPSEHTRGAWDGRCGGA